MSVLVKGIEMPKNCADCLLEYTYDGYNCRIVEKAASWGLEGRPSWCPLVELPTPHGDLIDAEKLIEAFKETDCIIRGYYPENLVRMQSPVIKRGD